MSGKDDLAGRVTSVVLDSAQVEKAVRESGGTEKGRVMKVLYVDDDGNTVGQWASQQIPENPFGARAMAGLIEPPYRLEQLVYLAEQHPVHSAAIEQKTVDVCGTGWDWMLPENEQEDDDDEQAKKDLDAWFQSLAPDDESMQEVLAAAWDDVETTGWGLIECVRDPMGLARKLYHVPGHSVRAHKDGIRFVQKRGTSMTYFKKWGVTREDGTPYKVDSKTGSYTDIKELASDMLVIKRKSRRSTWYGIPGYISAIGYLTLALAARDDNLAYFHNRREPRWAIILSNLEDNPKIEEDIRRAFTVDLKNAHRNIIIPIAGEGKIDFQQLSNKNGAQDGTFMTLADACDKRVLIGHRIPAERLANTAVGALGGNVADEANRVYKEGYCAPAQHLYETRLNKFIAVEYPKFQSGENPDFDNAEKALARKSAVALRKAGDQTVEQPEVPYRIKFDDLDLDEDKAEADYAVNLFKSDGITLGEFRHRLGLGPLMKPKEPEYDPTPDPTTGMIPPKPVFDPETFNPETDLVESEYNYMLYSELPGVSKGGTGYAPQDLPNAQPETDPNAADPAAANLDKAREAYQLAGLRADLAEMLTQARSSARTLQELAERE